jgi:hypothetical protein
VGEVDAVANVTMQAPELESMAVTSVALSTVDAHAPVPTLAAETGDALRDTAPTEAAKSEKAKTVRRNISKRYPD